MCKVEATLNKTVYGVEEIQKVFKMSKWTFCYLNFGSARVWARLGKKFPPIKLCFVTNIASLPVASHISVWGV